MNETGIFRQALESGREGTGSTAHTSGAATVLDPVALEGLRQLDPNGQSGVLRRVLGAYQQSLGRHLDELQRASAGDDVDSLMRIAHTLKSSSAAVGALQLSRRCAELETACRSDGVASAARVEALIHEAQQVVRAVADMLPG